MELNEVHNSHEHASVSLKVILLVFAVVLIGALSYLVWNEQLAVTDSGNVVIKRNSTSKVDDVKETSATKETLTLKAVDGSTSTGDATRVYDKTKGLFTHTVEATLTDPADDKFYEGWLVRGKSGDANFKFVSTGKLAKGDDGKWTVSFTSPMDHYEFSQVVITLETLEDGLDNKPEKHIIEATFTG